MGYISQEYISGHGAQCTGYRYRTCDPDRTSWKWQTLLALAAALELVIEKGFYDKVIVTRNTPEIAESIGFLPGTEEEKMAPVGCDYGLFGTS